MALFWGRLALSIPYGHKEQSCNLSSLMPFNIVQSTSSHCGARTQFVKSYVKSPIHCSRLASFSLKRVEGKMKLNETEKRMFDKADCILSSRLEKRKEKKKKEKKRKRKKEKEKKEREKKKSYILTNSRLISGNIFSLFLFFFLSNAAKYTNVGHLFRNIPSIIIIIIPLAHSFTCLCMIFFSKVHPTLYIPPSPPPERENFILNVLGCHETY